MKKQFSFLLLAAALLVSVPSWAYDEYEKGEERNLGYYNLPLIGHFGNTSNYGTICLPERIVAVQGITIYEVLCVDRLYSDSTKVARLVVEVHEQCVGDRQAYYDTEKGVYYDEPFCPESQQSATNPCSEKTYLDWVYRYGEPGDPWYEEYDHRLVAGAAYFYTACSGVSTLEGRKVYVDKNDVATAPVCVDGFYGTFENTYIAEPIVVLSQDTKTGSQFLEKAKQVTMPANRGYFKGDFECVPWRWNTFSSAEPNPYPSSAPNPLHYSCSEPPKVPRRVSSEVVMFNVGPRDAATGLYQVDFEHPIYLGKETNKRIENGQLILEAADGTKYNAFGQRVQ